MTLPPIPVVFEPIFKAKPWGGQRLATLLDKPLPAGQIGESWELVNLPGDESHVRDGPLAGVTLGELVQLWGTDLLGTAALSHGRFPLLLKFLDASQNLSIQVHPKPAADDPTGRRAGIKHEAWYVLHVDPGAQLFVGLKPGVAADDVLRVANTPAMIDVLRVWDAQPGQSYYLPSGTLHALGAGLVVVEVQTPSDITYRAYDWGRVGTDGCPRELHVEQALRNIRYDVTEDTICQPPVPIVGSFGGGTRLVRCERFVIDLVRPPAGLSHDVPSGSMRVWIVLAGGGRLVRERCGSLYCCGFAKGDVVLIPYDSSHTHVELNADCEWLEVTIPLPGSPPDSPAA